MWCHWNYWIKIVNAVDSPLTKRGGDKLNAGKALLVSWSTLSQCKFSLGSEQHECVQCQCGSVNSMNMFIWRCAQGNEPSKKYWGMQCRGTKPSCIKNITTFTWSGLLNLASTEPVLLFLLCGVDELDHPHRHARKYVHLFCWTDATNITVHISWQFHVGRLLLTGNFSWFFGYFLREKKSKTNDFWMAIPTQHKNR